MRRIVMGSVFLAIAPLCVIGVALTTTTWWEALFTAVTLLGAMTLLKEWNLDRYTPRAVFVFVCTGAIYLYGAFLANSPISFMPFALVGSLVLLRLTKHRWPVIALFALGVATLGATALLMHPLTPTLVITFVIVPALGTLFIAVVVVISEQAWQLVRDAERAKDVESALAVAEERIRFAGDLHDIQGQSLHVIKLKAALAQRLAHDDPARAAEELAEIRRMVDDTVAQTRELTYARYEIDLVAELENTRALAEASGMQVTVRRDLVPSVEPHPLLAHTLREATTNLLRHADPSWVTITARSDRVEVSNDGARSDGELRLRGIERLRGRIRDAGGELRATREGDVFTISATLAPAGTHTPAPATAAATEEKR